MKQIISKNNNYNKIQMFGLPNNKIIFFIFIILRTSLCDFCGSYLPNGIGSCTIYNTPDQHCCLLTTFTNDLTSTLCYPIPFSQYLALKGQITLNGYSYTIDCGEGLGAICGNVPNPLSYKDCSQFSTVANSCCYYEYLSDTGCVWLGQPYLGELSTNGIKLICSTERLYLNILYLSVVIFLMLVL